MNVSADTTWSADVTVSSAVEIEKGTLTIAPGVKVTFQAGGKLSVASGAALVAKGTEANPVRFAGDGTGSIAGWDCAVLFEGCEFIGVGTEENKRQKFLDVTPGSEGVTLKKCRLTECGAVWVSLKGPFTMEGCDVRRKAVPKGEDSGLRITGKGGKAVLAGNTFQNMGVGLGEGTEGMVRDNIIVDGTLSGWRTDKLTIEGNYIHRPAANGTYGLSGTTGTIRDNVIRGGSWVTAGLGGTVTGNVLISLPSAKGMGPGEYDKQCTHEHICGLQPNATVARNIFVGASYGAVMGIGKGTGLGSIIRNNTFDMREHGNPVFLNHLPEGEVRDIVIRGNIFLRCGSGVLDEKGVPDSAKYIDCNLWVASPGKGSERYRKVEMKGLKPGDAGFGKNDFPPAGGEVLSPAAVVANPDVEFPFTDEEILARKHTVAEVLECYRKAYSLKEGSPALNRGDPADKDDPAVKDGKPDAGALEFAK